MLASSLSKNVAYKFLSASLFQGALKSFKISKQCATFLNIAKTLLTIWYGYGTIRVIFSINLCSVVYLLLCVACWLHREVQILHGLLHHGHGVRPVRVRVDALVRYDGGDVPEHGLQLGVALLLRHLELTLGQNLAYIDNMTPGAHPWPESGIHRQHLLPILMKEVK